MSTRCSRPRRRSIRLGMEMLEPRLVLSAPSGLEQEMLEWVNRLRMDPAGEYARFVSSESPLLSPIPGVASALAYFGVNRTMLRSELAALTATAPLAWNEALSRGAEAHNAAMIAADSQSHQVPGEAALGTRLTSAGYTGWSTVAENIFAFADVVAHGHAAFVVDWGGSAATGGMQSPRGHRNTLMNPDLREVGIAVTRETSTLTDVGEYVITQDFGARFGVGGYLLGVVFDDANNDVFYANGEGRGGVSVRAQGAAGTFTTTTWASGGYQLELPAGTYTVTFSGGALATPVTRAVVMGGSNRKVDIEVGSPGDPGTIVRMESSTLGVTEGGTVSLALVREGDLSGETVVTLVTEGASTLSAGERPTLPAGGVVRFTAGQSRAEVLLTFTDDATPETTETLVLAVQSSVAVGFPVRTTVMVSDNDRPAAPIAPSLVGVSLGRTVGRRSTLVLSFTGNPRPSGVSLLDTYVVRRAGADRRLGTADDLRVRVLGVSWDPNTGLAFVTVRGALRKGERVQVALKPGRIVAQDGTPFAGRLRRAWLLG